MKTVISVKVDKDVRDKAQKVAKKLGLSLSLVVNSGLRRFAEEERLVIETPQARTMSKMLERRLAPIEADIKAGRNLSPAFTNAKDAIAWLNS
jgi:addiction module RelB/DinJ family antitoxin